MGGFGGVWSRVRKWHFLTIFDTWDRFGDLRDRLLILFINLMDSFTVLYSFWIDLGSFCEFFVDFVGGGSETQGKMVSEALEKQGHKVFLHHFPHYDTAIGKSIREFLYDHKDLTVEKQFLLYTMQFIFDAEEIRKESEEGIVIADRYFTATLVFQTLQGFSEEKALEFADTFGILKPEKIFFLDVAPETAYTWKHGEEKEKNAWEEDMEFIKKTYSKYLDLCQRNIFASWSRIIGERTKQEVCDTIVEQINSEFISQNS
jgi:dTMP kinase